MSRPKRLGLVARAGAGLGHALRARCETDDVTPVGLGRSRPDTSVGTVTMLDLSDEAVVCRAIEDIGAQCDRPKQVIPNAVKRALTSFDHAHLGDRQRIWDRRVQSAVLLAQATVDPTTRAGWSAFANAAYAPRGLIQSLAGEVCICVLPFWTLSFKRSDPGLCTVRIAP